MNAKNINRIIGYSFLAVGVVICLSLLISFTGKVELKYFQNIYAMVFSGRMGEASAIFVTGLAAIGAYLVKE